MLGVGESTIKRWVDLEILPAERTAGRHRKIRMDDLMRVIQERNLPHVRPRRPASPGSAGADVPALSERLYLAVVEGDHQGAMAAVREAHEGGLSVARIGDELVAPVMARVGHAWATAQLDVYQEHRGTQACLFALLALKLRLPHGREPGKPLALGGGAEGDHYFLANLLIEMVLLEEGWNVENLGPNTPAASLCRAVRERRPRLVWMSCSYMPAPEAFLAGFQSLHQEAQVAGASLAVGGRALSEAVRARMDYSHFGDRLVNLATFARDLRRPS